LHELPLLDLGSTNGTWLRGRRVRKWALTHGDEIEIGKHRLLFFAA